LLVWNSDQNKGWNYKYPYMSLVYLSILEAPRVFLRILRVWQAKYLACSCCASSRMAHKATMVM